MTTQQPPDPAKELAFYSAMLDAWVATRMEKDKTVLALAAGGIGLLVTLLTTVGPTSKGQLWLYAVAGLSFVGTVVFAILIFERNGDHIEEVFENRKRGPDLRLRKLDAGMLGSFILGVLLTCAVAVGTGYSRLEKENSMSKQQIETTTVKPGETKSLSGIGNLAPAPAAPAASQITETVPTAPTTVTQPANSSPSTPKE